MNIKKIEGSFYAQLEIQVMDGDVFCVGSNPLKHIGVFDPEGNMDRMDSYKYFDILIPIPNSIITQKKDLGIAKLVEEVKK